MKSQEKFPTKLRQFVFLFDLLSSSHLTLREIQDRWDRSSVNNDEDLKRGRWFSFKSNLEEFFGVDISCNKVDNSYHLENAPQIKNNSFLAWMMQTARVGTLFIDNFEKARHFILEDMPSGDVFLFPLMKAFSSHCKVAFLYQKYSCDKPKAYSGSPICVRQYNRRWYLILKRGERMITFSLDRIKEMELLEKDSSSVTDFCYKDVFDEYYGIYCDERLPYEKDIIVQAYGERVKYLRDLPLHISQYEIATEKEYSDFHYSFRPDNCFIAEVLRLGGDIQVLQPSSLVQTIANRALKLFSMHNAPSFA